MHHFGKSSTKTILAIQMILCYDVNNEQLQNELDFTVRRWLYYVIPSTHTHILTHNHTRTQSSTHTLAYTQAYSHIRSMNTHTTTHVLIHKHIHTRTRTHSHTTTHTQTHTCYVVSPSCDTPPPIRIFN